MIDVTNIMYSVIHYYDYIIDIAGLNLLVILLYQ